MWQAWPSVALKYHPFREERDVAGRFVFRGPRCVRLLCASVGALGGCNQQLLRLEGCTPWAELVRQQGDAMGARSLHVLRRLCPMHLPTGLPQLRTLG